MITKEITMQTIVTGTEDGKETFEIRRRWKDGGKKALVIELYPTIVVDFPMLQDVSTMHLLNHAEELGWGEVQIVNLYPYVFARKPTVAQLSESHENLEYIRDILTGADIEEYDIVIAWGSSLATHATTNYIKKKILKILQEHGLEMQTKHIVTDNMDTKKQLGTHPLFLGLRYSGELWRLENYPLKTILEQETAEKKVEKIEDTEKKKGRKVVSKENVLQDK